VNTEIFADADAVARNGVGIIACEARAALKMCGRFVFADELAVIRSIPIFELHCL
jgi:hypothetical protein